MTLPLFPLRSVLFPGLVLPLRIFEPRYRVLVEKLNGNTAGEGREFGVVAIRRGVEVGAAGAEDLYDVGCTAELTQVRDRDDGGYDIVTVGRRRFRTLAIDRESAPYLNAEVEWLPERSGPAGTAERLAPSALAAFRRYLRLARPDAVADDQLPEDPVVLSHLIAATASLDIADRQGLLAAPDTATRLRVELGLLHREVTLFGKVRAVPADLRDFQTQPSPN